MVRLSQSLEDYIEAIYLINRTKKVVRVKEIAKFLGVKTPSVVDAVSKLQDRGFVTHEKYGYLYLTKKGVETAKSIYKKHEEVYKFLNQFLGMNKNISEKDACEIEHYISKETLDRIIKLMKYIESGPEGYPEWLSNFNSFAGAK